MSNHSTEKEENELATSCVSCNLRRNKGVNTRTIFPIFMMISKYIQGPPILSNNIFFFNKNYDFVDEKDTLLTH